MSHLTNYANGANITQYLNRNLLIQLAQLILLTSELTQEVYLPGLSEDFLIPTLDFASFEMEREVYVYVNP